MAGLLFLDLPWFFKVLLLHPFEHFFTYDYPSLYFIAFLGPCTVIRRLRHSGYNFPDAE
jgi:hypothetical protein